MEILKIKKTMLMLVVAGMMISIQSFGQDYASLQKAFKESYAKENAGETSAALAIMKSVYDEGSYEINIRLGWLSYNTGNFMESIAYYQKAISLKPFAIEPRFGLVLPASAMGNWDMVKVQYTKVLEIDPMNTKANYYMGMIKYNAEEFEAALDFFERVVNLYPFDYDGMIMYAWTNYRLGKLREAKVLFNKVLMISPDDSSALEGLKLIQ